MNRVTFEVLLCSRRFVFSLLALVTLGTLMAITASPVWAAPGDLDTSFDSDGKVTTNFSFFDQAHAVALQSDGKIVAAGVSDNLIGADFALARYNTDGSLGTSFDTDGKVTTDFGGYDQAIAVAIQQDGKIIAAGGTDATGGLDFALARYNTDGSLDTSFDTDGKVTTDFGGFEQASAVVIQTDGKIVAVGSTGGNFALARYNTDGSLDTSFDTDGKVTTDFGGFEFANAAALQSDGKIIAVGRSDADGGFDFALARYNTDGSLDTSFDTDGKVTTDFGVRTNALDAAIQTNGKIVAVGGSTDINLNAVDFALARYNTDGSLDTSFSGDGKVTTDFGDSEQASATAIQSNGKIIAAGRTTFSTGVFHFALARYNTDGSLDTSFSSDGKVTTDFGGNSGAFDTAIQSDGKIIAVGISIESGFSDFALARYQNGVPEPSNVSDQIVLRSLNTPPSGATPAGGIYEITAVFENIGPALTNLFFRVTESEYLSGALPGPELDNRDFGTPAGVGAELTADLSSVSGTLDTNETIEIVFRVLLLIIEPFSAALDALTGP